MIHYHEFFHRYGLNKVSINVEDEYINHVLLPDTRKLCGYTQLSRGQVPGKERKIWTNSFGNE